MKGKGKKGYLAKHAKSSAALVSLGIHAVLILVALSFVAVSVITKEDPVFEAKPVSRPKMQLKKLQVPVNVKKKKTQKPKLRKRIVVQPKLNQSMPDIKMPEISGVKGGLGAGAGTGLGGAGGLGFSMPEIELFGIKSKGEKVFLILDSSSEIMYDELGGIPAYTIIKEELVRIVEGLPPTALFNVAVYEDRKAFALFPKLVPASDANAAKCKAWLEPLNHWVEGMGEKAYGTRTLGPGGHPLSGDVLVDPLKSCRAWSRPVLHAMRQQADAVFILGSEWGRQDHMIAKGGGMSPSVSARYKEYVEKAKEKHKEENALRIKAGQPPRVIADDRDRVKAYFPSMKFPYEPNKYHRYTPDEISEALEKQRKLSASGAAPTKSGLRKKKKSDYSINVIQFVRKSGSGESGSFKQLAKQNSGEYESIMGLDAIKSSASE